MIDLDLLDSAIKTSGMSYKHLAKVLGISLTSFYNKRSGKTEFNASELHLLLEEIRAPQEVRAKIFA